MDIIKAFTYIFKDKKFYIPVIIGTLAYIPGISGTYLINNTKIMPVHSETHYFLIIAIYIASSFLSGIFTNGYYLVNANLRIMKQESPLLGWNNIKQIVSVGLKAYAAGFIYSVPLIIIGAISWYIYVISVFNSPKPSPVYPITMTILTIIALTISILVIPAFVTNLKFSSFFNYKLIFNLIKKNPRGFVLMVIFCLSVIAISKLVHVLKYNPYVIIPAASLVSFYVLSVKSDIIAQFVKGAIQKSGNE